jgi:Protein of unknown function (DUF1501)
MNGHDCGNTFDVAALKQEICRRTFLARGGASIGALALAALGNPELLRGGDAAVRSAPLPSEAPWSGVVRPLHFAPRAKRIIYLYMAGGPSHLETFDYKPKLAEMNGKPMPESFTAGQPIAQLQNAKLTCLAPQHTFVRCGQSGQYISSVFPRLAEVADEMCIIRSLHTDAINHDPAHTFMNTGTTISGRPSMGAWLTYGLGSDSQDLPGFVVMTSLGKFGQAQPIAARMWHSGFLPSRFQGVEFRSKGDAVLYLGNPPGVDRQRQSDVVEAVKALNAQGNQVLDDPEIATRVSQYEMAFRMQASVPHLLDVSDEPAHVMEMYGTQGADGSFAANCLLARRLAERGVRFIQLYHRDWDHHGAVKEHVQGTAAEVDRGAMALIRDLKQRGMLDETLIVYGGEFGRTPMAQGNGRDHHMQGFSMWLAGGGIRGGISHGATDELGYKAVDNPVHVNDLHATMLHLFGIDHTRLTYRFQGRNFRLTDVAGQVIRPILA